MQQEISLREIFFAIRKKWKWIVLGGVLGAFLAFALSAYVLPKKYTASLDMYVNNNREDTETGNRNQNDLNASQMLVDTYTVILENDAVLSQVAADLGHITLEELKQALRFGPVGATEVLRISAETEDPQLSADICNAVAARAPEVLQRVVKAGSVEAVAPATASSEPASPHVKRNTVFGALIFLALSVIAVVLRFALDTTVKGETDVKQRLDLPVLGEIPSFSQYGIKEGTRRVQS